LTAAPDPKAAAAAPLEPPETPQAGPRTRGGRLRPTVLLGGAVAVFLLAWVLSQTWTAGDQAVAGWVGRNLDDSERADWRAASWPGATVTLFVVAVVGALACLAAREGRAAASTFVVGMASGLLVQGLKAAISRDRPEGAVLESYAFPSGHSTTGMVAWGLLALVVLPAVARHVRITPLARRFAIGLWIGVAVATGATRVLGGVHWASDVVAGWALGGCLLVIAVRAAHTDRPPPRVDPAAGGHGSKGEGT
jgi:membrane-associated phospholipid phosphatase